MYSKHKAYTYISTYVQAGYLCSMHAYTLYVIILASIRIHIRYMQKIMFEMCLPKDDWWCEKNFMAFFIIFWLFRAIFFAFFRVETDMKANMDNLS